jgi:hypothetical protein
MKGPVDGGQPINIRGANFGLNTFEIKEILVRGVVCKNVQLVNSGLITCMSGASTIMGPGVGNVIIKKITELSSPTYTCNMYEYSISEIIIVPPAPLPPPPIPRPFMPIPIVPVCVKPIRPAIVVKDFNIKPHKLFSFKQEDPSREDMLNSLNRHMNDKQNNLFEKIDPVNYFTDNNFANPKDGFRKKRFAKILEQIK